jgi:hypothetical protein
MSGAAQSGYLFRFERPEDRASYTRRVCWERLYAFFRKGPPALAASRVVPANAELFALYLALKKDGKPVHREVLPKLAAPRGAGIVRSMADIIPHGPRGVPAAIAERTGHVLERTAELSASLDDRQFVLHDAQRGRARGGRGGAVGAPMGQMPGVAADDAAVIGMGFELNELI